MSEILSTYRIPGFWLGAAETRDYLGEMHIATSYRKIASELESGRPLEDISEFQAWFSRRTTWS